MTVEKIRGLVRPFVTVLMVLALVVFEGFAVFALREKPGAEFLNLVAIIVAFWFAERKTPPTTP